MSRKSSRKYKTRTTFVQNRNGSFINGLERVYQPSDRQRELARIAKLPRTPLQEQIIRRTRRIVLVIIGIVCILVLLVSYFFFRY